MSTGILTPEAKDKLRRTVRELRERLLRDIHDAAEGAYRLSVPASQAGLGEAQRIQRTRLEDWLDERARATRPKDKAAHRAACDRLRLAAEKEAAATLLNRLVLIRHLEALGLSRPEILKGGWNSKGFREYRDFAPGLCDDDTEGYALLLALLFDELAGDLPGLFGDVGTTRLFPVPAATLRAVVESLDDPEPPSVLASLVRRSASARALASCISTALSASCLGQSKGALSFENPYPTVRRQPRADQSGGVGKPTATAGTS